MYLKHFCRYLQQVCKYLIYFCRDICHYLMHVCRYLRRFRNDPPLHRQQRKTPSLSEFWWGSKSTSATREPIHSKGVAGTARDKESTWSSRVKKSSAAEESCSTGATDNSTTDRDFDISSDVTPKSHSSSSKVRRCKIVWSHSRRCNVSKF